MWTLHPIDKCGAPDRSVRFPNVDLQSLLGLSMEDPDPSVGPPAGFGSLKTWLCEGSRYIGSVWVRRFVISPWFQIESVTANSYFPPGDLSKYPKERSPF